MYVCNCNGVRKREVDSAIEAGAANPRQVLAHFGHEPCCGQCLPEIAACLGRRRNAAEQEASLVAAE